MLYEVITTSPSSKTPIIGPSSGVPVTISGTANDPSSGVKSIIIQIDSGAQIAATSTLNNYAIWTASTTIFTQGQHKLKVIATDSYNFV